jgi:hypothetical protein
MRARICEQGEGLIIEIEANITTCPVEIDNGNNAGIHDDEMLLKIVQRMPGRLAPRTAPTEPSRFAIRKGLPRDRSGAVRPGQRLAIEVDGFMEAAAVPIRTHLPPQRQRVIKQPAPQRCRFYRNAIHVDGASR